MSFFKRHPPPPDSPDTDDEAEASIDPQLRLRTVRTAASTIAESVRVEERAARRKSHRARFFRRGGTEKGAKGDHTASIRSQASVAPVAAPTEVPGLRRTVYVNMSLPAAELDANNEPLVRYERNKVRTSKYTLITFLPKNLYEQFRRVANIYFLALIVVQQFSVFGATNGQIAMLPLLFIIGITAIKDGVEDYRRSRLDDEVNNSAATKLEGWRNANQPRDPRGWAERALGLNKPGEVTRGVRRLREREASEGRDIVLARPPRADGGSMSMSSDPDAARTSDGRLEDIQSIDEHEHSYPPGPGLLTSLSAASSLGAKTAGGDSSTHLVASPPASYDPAADAAAQADKPGGGSVIDYSKRGAGTARWERTLWKKLEVGDVVLLRGDEQVPADIVVLATSDADGLCYLETKNLDGETNLKPRRACRSTGALGSEADVERAAFALDSEPAHQNLYVYHGVLRYTEPRTGAAHNDAVTIDELLLRGCTLRNTDWVIGLVVFTGADTKIMLNGGATPSKRSKIEKETNFNVVMNLVILVGMCAITAVGSGILDGKQDTSAKFFEVGSDASNSAALNGIVTFVAGLILFQNIVPISLYISIEIVKTIQAFFIAQDLDMYYAPFDTACVPKTWNISDDLGQIEYVFSDKTGTLTQNVMEFQKCSVGGVQYGEGITEAQRGAAQREGRAGELMSPDEQREHLAGLKDAMLAKMARAFKNRYLRADHLTLIDPKLADDLADRAAPQRAQLLAFFRALALCHSVLAAHPDPDQPFVTEYKAESPDEAALVAAARDVGVPFVGRTKHALDIEVLGQPERHAPLRTIEFTSTRKRMSVLARGPDGRITLYCKGADSVIYQRLAPDHDQALKDATARDMEAFANGGLRTLCIASRAISEDEYLRWSRTADAAAAATKDRDAEIDKANELIEHSLTILGATALEDKLQEGVPEAIEQLHQAGIKLWILTGDKLQTAIEIGYSCNLLKSEMDIMIISADTPDAARAMIEAGLNKIASVLGPPSLNPNARGFSPNAKASFAVVIDGDTLRYALDGALKPLFLALGTQCETVVCCRVSPAQKALTVKLVKEGRDAMTLSIGDGANDVAMIQEANIGCGLFGLEGSQAAMSADYAFGQFRFLTKLLLVHGRWSYYRIAAMHCNFFYKNMIWTFAMFWFQPWNSFDAAYLYEYTFILLCNLVFTSLPVIVLGAFDQDINAKAALAFPQLYIRGIRGLEYTRTRFWLYMADGLYQSAVVFFIPYAIWSSGLAVSWNGNGIESVADFGTTVAVTAIFIANAYVGMNTAYWTIITWAVLIGSDLLMVIWIIVYSFIPNTDFVNETVVLFGELTFWVTVVLTSAIALLPRFLTMFFTTVYMPQDQDIIREAWVMGDLKDQLGIQHRRDRRRGRAPEHAGGDLETAPMYKNPHMRSASEIDHSYQPVLSRSPQTGADGLAAPPPAHSRSTSPAPGFDDDAQYIVVDRSPTRQDPPASRLSYYSVSNIPPPSPLPPTRYSTVSSASHPGTPRRRSSTKAAAPLLSPVHREKYLHTGPSSPPPVSYEMRVRSPPAEAGSIPPSPYERRDMSRASNRSYATAEYATAEDYRPGEDEDPPASADLGVPGQRHDRPESPWQGVIAE